ncbi:LOW QUALITY PROTEIN: transposase, IS4 family [Hallella multisaccharivorax DSM 17128]|uniref:Transposase, IS4 family n=1 Tax=Hallella multisaccharivorax DSM 17128 TaxID=688246 RepID=F8N6B3_9BACT|nr:LOW QUALITY PROTEIN: transposase, IS4 family [Hallella multisaccharivorax DSM 17128]
MQKETIYREPMSESLFEEEFTLDALSKLGNPLERLSKLVDFEMFRPILEEALLTKECKSQAGRKPIDVVLMFKVIFLQRYYGLGDHQIEFQIVDRTSFRQFLGIHTVAEVPDEKTVWACKEKLCKNGTFDKLFDEFRAFLDQKGLFFHEGKIIDATFVEAPKQRNSREVKQTIKEGRGNELWNPGGWGHCQRERKHKRYVQFPQEHKNPPGQGTPVRFTTANKDHVKADKKTKLIEKHFTTSANVHDSKVVGQLLEDKDKGQDLYLDAGYVGKDQEVEDHGMNPIICEKGMRNHPLTEEQKSNNREKSKARCRIEHIFGFVEGAMNGSIVRSIGMLRAAAATALTDLVYNIFRYEQFCRCQPGLIKEALASVQG